MADPSRRTTIEIGDLRFNALAAHVGFSTVHDHTGMPMMGSLMSIITATVDLHDTNNVPFAMLQQLFDLGNLVTRDKIKDIAVSFWVDELQQDAICVYRFRGWVSHFATISGEGSNHLLSLSLQPALDTQQFVKVAMSN